MEGQGPCLIKLSRCSPNESGNALSGVVTAGVSVSVSQS